MISIVLINHNFFLIMKSTVVFFPLFPLSPPSLPFCPLLFPSVPFCPLLSPSLLFSPILSHSLKFFPRVAIKLKISFKYLNILASKNYFWVNYHECLKKWSVIIFLKIVKRLLQTYLNTNISINMSIIGIFISSNKTSFIIHYQSN